MQGSSLGIQTNTTGYQHGAGCPHQGAEEMGQMELLLNVYTAQKARGAVADFMGHCTVPAEQATSRLTPASGWCSFMKRSG